MRIDLTGNRRKLRSLAAGTAFALTSLAVRDKVAASTQNQALSALLFLYKEVLLTPLPAIELRDRARMPMRLPVVLARDEVRRVLAELTGVPRLVASLLYGGGLRLTECLALRVKDIDFERRSITVRRGKGQKDRTTLLPASIADGLRAHLETVRETHRRDLEAGLGRAVLPDALDRKYPNAGTEWSWRSCFRLPASVETTRTVRRRDFTYTNRRSSER